MTSQLFGREYSVVVSPADVPTFGGFDVSNLRCTFRVKKNLKPEPNTAEVEIYNLAESSRRVLESASKLNLRLEAGYEQTGTAQLFLGQVRHAVTTWEGPDSITSITTGDSEKEIRESRLQLSVGPAVPVPVALTAIARALKVSPGNIGQATALLATKGVANMFGPGTVISGNAARELTDFCRSAGLEWSVQDGQLQILNLNKPLAQKAVFLSSATGLVGSPSVDGKGIVTAQALIIPDLQPGRLVVFDSRQVKGGYRIEHVEWTGDSNGADWYANLACKKF
jgi:hypothetical protein